MRDISEFNTLKYKKDNVRVEYCSNPAEDSNVDCYSLSLGEWFPVF